LDSSALIEHENVSLVIDLRKAFISGRLDQFISVLKAMPIQRACLGIEIGQGLWVQTGKVLRKSFGPYSFPVSFLTDFLCVSHLGPWREYFGLVESNGNLTYPTSKRDPNKIFGGMILPQTFLKASALQNLLEFLNIDRIETKPPHDGKL
jgi:hypothetical protein